MVLSFFFFLATPHSLWDHNSPQGIEPVTLAISVSSPNNWTARKFPNCLTNTIILLLGPSLLCLLHNRPVNPRDEVLRQGRDFNRGAGRQRRWQASTSKQPSYWCLDARGFFIDQRLGEVRNQSEKAINVANISQNAKPQAGNVFISSFLPSTGGQGCEQRQFSLSGRGARFSAANHSV